MGAIVNRVVAYDYRVPLDSADSSWDEWTAQRRRQYLSAQDVEFPLSADQYAWPGALSGATEDSLLPDADLDALGWRSLKALETAIAADGPPDGWLIALTEVCDKPHYLQGRPSSLPSHAVLLGYDIVDEGGLSVLTNHGRSDPSADDSATPSYRWAPMLNGHHLFGEVADARQFRRVSKEQDLALNGGAGHGQFCLIGVWVLDGQKWTSAS